MIRSSLILFVIATAEISVGQPPSQDMGKPAQTKTLPVGWRSGAPPNGHSEDYEMGVDTTEKHSGKASAYIELKAAQSKGFATLSQGIKADAYRGKRVRLSAFVKAENVASAGLWMRVDGEDGMVAFDNMMDRAIRGTSHWQKYEITLDVAEDAIVIPYGFLLAGKGRVWADDFRLDVVGQDVPLTNMEEAVKSSPKYPQPKDAATVERRKKFVESLPRELVNTGFEDF